MADPIFNPNKPFTDVGKKPILTGSQPVFNPNEPFTESGNNAIQQENGFIDNVTNALQERVKGADQSLGNISNQFGEDKSLFDSALAVSRIPTRLGGAVAGGVGDVIGEGLASAGRTIADNTPDSIKDPIKKGFNTLMSTDVGKLAQEAVSDGLGAYQNFRKSNPQVAKDLEDVFNIGLLFAPTKVKAKLPPITAAVDKTSKLAQSVLKGASKSLDKSANKKRMDFLLDLATQKDTKLQREALTKRTELSGILKTKVVKPSKIEITVAKELRKIKNLSPFKSNQANLNIISKEANKIGDIRRAQLSKRRTFIPDAGSKIDEAIEKIINENPIIVGDASKVAASLGEQAKKIISKNGSTLSGIDKSRVEFDQLVKSQKPNTFNPTASDNAFSFAVKGIRNSMNKMIDDNTSIATQRIRKRHSNLLKAKEKLLTRAEKDANNLIIRSFQTAARLLPGDSKLVREIGLFTGLSAIAASSQIFPTIAAIGGVGLVGVGATKLITSPTTKRGIAALLRANKKALKISTNKEMLKQLRLDQRALIELLDNSETEEDK